MNHLRGIPFHKSCVLAMGFFLLGGVPLSNAQFIQEVNVTIEGYTFRTTQTPLELNAETVIPDTAAFGAQFGIDLSCSPGKPDRSRCVWGYCCRVR